MRSRTHSDKGGKAEEFTARSAPTRRLSRLWHSTKCQGGSITIASSVIAMDLAVTSLQDRSTLCRARRSDITWDKEGVGRWVLTRSKTGANLAIRIRPGTKLENAVRRALAFPVAGTFLIRRNPERKSRQLEEFSQVTPDRLTKEFAVARDAAEAYKDLDPAVRPPFHFLRAYGAWLDKEAGYAEQYVQALMAHASPETTAMYQEGHEEPEIEYIDVDAEL